MCRVLEVSTSGYYDWRGRAESRRQKEDRRLVVEIKAIHKESRQTYGSPRIHDELKDRGRRCGKKRVARLMQLHGLRAKQTRRFKATTDSKHTLPVAENVLARQFTVSAPDVAWSADITYIPTRQGWLYLAVVLDLFSRRVVGWSMHKRLKRSLVLDALKMALRGRSPAPGLIHHSDRGSQYASGDYQGLLQARQMVCSMSRRGNCWDNAPVESFFSTLKRELVHHRRYQTRAEARVDIFEYIEVWYNRLRRHSSLGYQSPAQYEELFESSSLTRVA